MDWGSHPALLIIDVCQAYWHPGSPLFLGSPADNPAAAAVPAVIRRLLAAARAEGVPVFHSQVEYTRADMADAGLFWRKSKVLDCWRRGDPRGLMEMVEGIEVGEGEGVVVKKYASAFFGTCKHEIGLEDEFAHVAGRRTSPGGLRCADQCPFATLRRSGGRPPHRRRRHPHHLRRLNIR